MATIPFTQFKFPHGHRVPQSIERPEPVCALASELVAAGWSFEIECEPDTQMILADVCDDDGELAVTTVANGPGVPPAIDALVAEAHAEWIARGKPNAKGNRRDRYEEDWL